MCPGLNRAENVTPRVCQHTQTEHARNFDLMRNKFDKNKTQQDSQVKVSNLLQSEFVAVDAGRLPGKYSLCRGTSGLKCLAFSFRLDRLAATIFPLALHYAVLYPHASPLLVLAAVALSCITSGASVCHQCHPP